MTMMQKLRDPYGLVDAKKLAELEEDAQASFFELQTRWGG